MDCSRIPFFATFRQTGTVIMRVRTEGEDGCRPAGPSYCPARGPAACDKCFRTRSRNFSNCDSEKVTGRQYRASSARSKYVNACAAVCLVLLVGDILPLSSAAPRRRTMSRDRRSTEENNLWGNPCDYGSNPSHEEAVRSRLQRFCGFCLPLFGVKATTYSAKLASRVANQARSAYKSTSSYKDEFASKLHSYPNFEKLLPVWSGFEWLRNFTWFRDGILPKEKVFNGEVSPEYLDILMGEIDEVLPLMYKGLKMIVAGLNSISQEGLNEDIIADVGIKQNIAQSVQDVRAVLCVFFDVMKSRNLEIPLLPDSEVQDINKEEKLRYSLLVYRDTLNYLEYLAQVFQKLNDLEPSA